MTKFFKVNGTEIRKVCKCDEDGKMLETIALIGKVRELLENEIIFDDNTKGNEDKWLVVDRDCETFTEFETLEEAKSFCRQ